MADFNFSIPFNRAKDNMLTDLSSKYCLVMMEEPFSTFSSEFFVSMDKEQRTILSYFEKIMKSWVDGDKKEEMLGKLNRYAYLTVGTEIGKWISDRTDTDREFMVNRCFLARRCVIEFWEQINKYRAELKEGLYD